MTGAIAGASNRKFSRFILRSRKQNPSLLHPEKNRAQGRTNHRRAAGANQLPEIDAANLGLGDSAAKFSPINRAATTADGSWRGGPLLCKLPRAVKVVGALQITHFAKRPIVAPSAAGSSRRAAPEAAEAAGALPPRGGGGAAWKSICRSGLISTYQRDVRKKCEDWGVSILPGRGEVSKMPLSAYSCGSDFTRLWRGNFTFFQFCSDLFAFSRRGWEDNFFIKIHLEILEACLSYSVRELCVDLMILSRSCIPVFKYGDLMLRDVLSNTEMVYAFICWVGMNQKRK